MVQGDLSLLNERYYLNCDVKQLRKVIDGLEPHRSKDRMISHLDNGKNLIKNKKTDCAQAQADLVASFRLVLSKALTAKHWAPFCGLERDLTILLAIVADSLVHFPWHTVIHV